jgi:CRP-like cAMP-binding protein
MAPGKVIVAPDKALDALYVILDGGVAISRDGIELHVARQNEVLGAWALFDPEPMNVTAKTVEDTRLLRIGRDDFYDLLSDNSEITASIFSMLVRRFRQLVEK